MSQRFTLGLIGNPNCGKTTVFNALTGSRQRVGNWPGVTVERVSGEYSLGGNTFEVVDLPGTYSLDVTDQEVSLDEQVARSYAQEQTTHLVVNVVDASNLERNLYLTTQLAEMQVPLLLAVNMNFVAFSAHLGDLAGQVFTMFVLTVAAAEAAIGLAILVVFFRNRGTIAVEDVNVMKG